MTKALITGVTGQDGSYLSEFLLSKDYDVYGMIRRTATENTQNIDHLLKESKFHLIHGDLINEHYLCNIIYKLQPDEIYNLAAQSDVAISFTIPEYTGEITGLSVTRLLEAIRIFSPHSKFYQASSSEMFGNYPPPQNENTPFKARSPYSAAKIYAHNITVNYRESYGLFACCGILFNHESERRGLNFVTRKISNAVAKISLGKQDKLLLGNIQAKRDWGYSPDYVHAMWLMLQKDTPDDYVIGTGRSHTIKDFLIEAFKYVNMDWQKYTEYNVKEYTRPSDVNFLLADSTKANKELLWRPKTTFKELVKKMVKHDILIESV